MINKKFLKTSVCSAFLAISMNANAGIPTIDGAVVGQGIQDFIQFLAQYSDQLDTWGIEDENFNTQFASLTTGLNIVDDVLGGDLTNKFKELDFNDAFSSVFGSDIDSYIGGLAANGIDGLSSGVSSKIKEAYPKNGDTDTSEGRAENAVSEACGMYEGLALELKELTKAEKSMTDKAIGSMQDIVSKITGGGGIGGAIGGAIGGMLGGGGAADADGGESASKVASMQSGSDLVQTEYLAQQEKMGKTRQEIFDQRNQYKEKCETASNSYAQIVAQGVGFAAGVLPLIFGSKKKNNGSTSSGKSFDARF